MGLFAESHALEVFFSAGFQVVGVDFVVAAENTGDIYMVGTGHAVAAAGAAHFDFFADFLFHLLDQIFFLTCQAAHGRMGSTGDVFYYHF